MADLHQIQRHVDMLAEHLRQLAEYADGTLRMLRGPQVNGSAGPSSLTSTICSSAPLARLQHDLQELGDVALCIGDSQRETRRELFGEQIEESPSVPSDNSHPRRVF